MTDAVQMVRKRGPRDIRRMAGLQRAAEMLGEQTVLADALGVNPRLLRRKITAERPIHDADLRIAAAALVAHAKKATDLAAKLTSLITEQGDS